jgi:galactokinase
MRWPSLGLNMAPRPRWSPALRYLWTEGGFRERLEALDGFEAEFGKSLLWVADVPARICVLGEHSDYVPYLSATMITFASSQKRMLALISPRDDGKVRIASSMVGCNTGEFMIADEVIEGEWLQALDEKGTPDRHWSNYIRGAVARVLKSHDLRFGFDLFIHSSIPAASGTSSSSALTICGLLAIHLSNGLSWSNDVLAHMGGSAEWYVGTRGGLMDHATMAFAEEGALLELSTQPFETRVIPYTAEDCRWFTIFTHAADKGGRVMNEFNKIPFIQQEVIPPMLVSLRFEHPRDLDDWENTARALEETCQTDEFGSVRVRDSFSYAMRENLRVKEFLSTLGRGKTKETARLLEEAWTDSRDLLGIHTNEMESESERLRAISGVLAVKVMGAGFGGSLLVFTEGDIDLGSSAIEHTPGSGAEVLDFDDTEIESGVKCAAVLLCGGRGSRMVQQGVDVHKPLIPIDGVPSLIRVLDKLGECGIEFAITLVVVPPERIAEYTKALKGKACTVVPQPYPLGTGDAVFGAMDYLPTGIEQVYVSFGTQTLVQNDTIRAALTYHLEHHLGFTLPTTITNDPYAPLVRDDSGRVVDSVETHMEGVGKPEFGEANIGAYWASMVALKGVLVPLVELKRNGVSYDTSSGELGYPNEMVRACLVAGVGVGGLPCAEPSEMIGIKRIEDITIIEFEMDRRTRWGAVQ